MTFLLNIVDGYCGLWTLALGLKFKYAGTMTVCQMSVEHCGAKRCLIRGESSLYWCLAVGSGALAGMECLQFIFASFYRVELFPVPLLAFHASNSSWLNSQIPAPSCGCCGCDIVQGMRYINGFDDPHIIAGAGTMGMEIVDQVPDVEAVVVPVGGAGLIAGVALALKTLKPDVIVIVRKYQFRAGRICGLVADSEVYEGKLPWWCWLL